MTESYGGVFGAIPYAIRESDSWFFKIYGLIGTLAAAVVALVVTLALVVEMGRTEVLSGGGLASFSRSLFVLVGFLAVAPLLAPTLFVARRHRLGRRVHELYDQALAAAGYVFLASIYLALLISAPADLREPTTSPIVGALYALHPAFAVVPPVVAAAAIFLVHRRLSV